MKASSSYAALATAALLPGALALSGKFTVLTMNVAGLPAILNSNDVPGDKATNAGTIGSDFAKYGYDVIHVQEDFNYHAYIYATDTHPYRTATSGGVPFGSGLNTLSNFPFINDSRIKWNVCSDASENDCLTPKGFTFMRVAIYSSTSTAVYADFYNLHADAGTLDADNAARTNNILQVADYIATWSTGNAVFVYGDTNSRYSRTVDTGIRALLASQNATGVGLKDPWVELIRGGVVPTAETLCDNPSTNNTCETVDKVFYRASPLLNVQASAWNYVGTKFLQANGSVLSDHNPILVNFTWSSGAKLQQSGFWGGPHGDWFSDVPALAAKTGAVKAATLRFAGGSRLDSVGLTLADGTAFSHGGSGGTAATLSLGAAEYWTAAKLCQGQKDGHTRNFYILATTSAGRTLSAGTATSDCTTFTAPSGWQIVGYLGQAGDEMDQLAFVYAPQ